MDKFFQQILSGLDGNLNPNIFELCAVDLIRNDYPGAVPVVGGKDAGFDGAVADLKGEPFPIICTTQEDVIGNLTKNLDSYLSNGEKRRQVILVTNRSLSPPRQQNLRERAREKGFELVQLYERHSIAERLRNSPRWCKELLNLSGNLPPLTKVAPHSRLEHIALELTGRQEDLDWLNGISGDAVVCGQPGSGKTAIMMELVKQEGVYFVAGSVENEITASFRELKPKIVILDDAHAYTDKLDILLRIRKELGTDFKILAVVWPSKAKEIGIRLNVESSRCRELRLLTRDEIVDVIKNAGLAGPDEFIREIVNQAEGKPGLAVLLTSLCLKGDEEKFWNGDLLSSYVLSSVAKATGQQVKETLAAFSIGGDTGMPMSTVSEILKISVIEVSRIVAELDAAGIVTEVGDNLSVRPPTIRFALVRDVFFCGAKSIDSTPLITVSSDFDEATLVLLGASHRGASIAEGILVERIIRSDSKEVWSGFAWLGVRQTDYLLNKYADKIMLFLEPALAWSPSKTLPLLFAKAVGDNRPLNSNPGHPLRKIADWVSHVSPRTGNAIKVRSDLLTGIIKWIESGGEPKVAYMSLPSVFSVHFGSTNLDPGCGRTFQITRGTIGAETISEFMPLWERLYEFLKSTNVVDWVNVVDVVEQIVFPRRDISTEGWEECNLLAQRMINDLADLANQHPGIIRRLRDVAFRLDLDAPAEIDSVFAKLFPEREIGEVTSPDVFKQLASEISDEWKILNPEEVLAQILKSEEIARDVGMKWPRLTPRAIWELSEKVSNPIEWAYIFASGLAPTDAITPFVLAAINIKDGRWIEFVKENLDGPLQEELIQIVLMQDLPDDSLLEKVLPLLPKYVETVEHTVGRMPTAVLKRVLQHTDSSVKGHAAVGEWNAAKFDGNRPVRSEVIELWRAAVVQFAEDEYWLNEILNDDLELAFKWVKNRFESITKVGYESDKLIRSLCYKFTIERRRELLSTMPTKDFYSADIFFALMGHDLVLIPEVLKNERLENLHLELARWNSVEIWVERICALEKCGYTTRDISYSVLPRHRSWSGKESDMIKGWIKNIETVSSHENLVIREVTAYVLEGLNSSLKRALGWEYQEAVYGRN